jgi:hypothetical protein
MDLQKVFEGIVNTKNVELGNVLSYPTINDIYIEVFTKKESVAESVLDNLIDLLKKNEDYNEWHWGMKSYNSYWKDGNSFDRRAKENCYVVYAVKKD